MKNIIKVLKRRLKSLVQTREERRHAMVGQAKLWRMKRDFQFDFLKSKGLSPGHYLLDIGCGTLRGGIPLIDYLNEGHYIGVESRDEVLNEGKKELREAGLEDKNPKLLHIPDISKLDLDQKLDYIWAFSVLIHMTDEILYQTLNFANNYLSDQGVFYANVNIGDSSGGNWQGFPVMWRPVEFYNQACAKHSLSCTEFGTLKELGHITGDTGAGDNQIMLKITKI